MARRHVAELKNSTIAIALEPESIGGWGGPPTAAVIAERSSGDFVLTGIVDEEDSVIRFRFTLFDASARAPVWGHEISQANLDALAIRQELVGNLNSILPGAVTSNGAGVGAPSSEAYDHYLRGKILLDGLSMDDEDAAHRHLRTATQLAPDFAPAWRELARAQHRIFNKREAGMTRDDVRLLSALLERASVLAPSDAATQAYLAWHEIDFNGSLARGFERLAKAIELNPYDEDVLRVAMQMAYSCGDAASAVRFAEFSQRYNPLMQGLPLPQDAGADGAAGIYKGAGAHSTSGPRFSRVATRRRHACIYWAAIQRPHWMRSSAKHSRHTVSSTKIMILHALGRRRC